MDKNSVKLDADKGILTFQAKKGKSLDPDKLLDAIKKTSFHSKLNYLEVKAIGEVVIGKKETLLKVNGGTQQFVLGPDPDANLNDGEATPFQRLQASVTKGEKVVSVTGRVQGWGGDFRKGKRPADPKKADPEAKNAVPRLMVSAFETATPVK